MVCQQICQSVKRKTEAFRNLVFRQKLYKRQKPHFSSLCMKTKILLDGSMIAKTKLIFLSCKLIPETYYALPGEGDCPLFPWHKSFCSPFPQNQNLVFQHSMFPKLAFFTLLSSFLDFCSFFSPGRASFKHKLKPWFLQRTCEIWSNIQRDHLIVQSYFSGLRCCTTLTRINLWEFCPLYCLHNKLEINKEIKKNV